VWSAESGSEQSDGGEKPRCMAARQYTWTSTGLRVQPTPGQPLLLSGRSQLPASSTHRVARSALSSALRLPSTLPARRVLPRRLIRDLSPTLQCIRRAR